MRGTPLNWQPGTATGYSYSARPPLLRVLPQPHASIIPLLEVDDLDQASAELVRGGALLLGEPESDGIWTWLTYRAPDGNIPVWGARPA